MKCRDVIGQRLARTHTHMQTRYDTTNDDGVDDVYFSLYESKNCVVFGV